MPVLTLDTLIDQVYMIGPTYARRLKKLNIFTANDLLHHYPSRHNDLSHITTINQVKPDQICTIQGKIVSCQNIYTKLGKKIQKAVIQDSTGSIEAIWFNQTFIAQTLKPNLTVNLSGKVGWFNRRLTLTSPDYELIKDKQPVHTARLVPVYPETAGVSSKWLRSRIIFLLDKLKLQLNQDWLPENIKQKNNLINLSPALNQIHFPDNQVNLNKAHHRLEFDEMLLLQLEALIRKATWQKKTLSHKFTINQSKVLQLISSLPFKLTSAQNKCIKQILADLESDKPMNRLLQGDVGSGKTVVAAIAIYLSHLNGYKSILMAPTTILANQHFATLKTVFANTSIKLKLITSSTKKATTANADILVGTHALLFRKLKAKNIGLIIIDEQHRFGVKQRSKLISTSKTTPHLLSMTATPIPRTIALTAYADLDLSLLDQMPQGRKKVKTWVVPPSKRLSAYHWIENQLKKHKSQAFVVCPLIEPSDKETMKDIKSVTQEFDNLTQIFNQLKLDLLHGRLTNKQKNSIIANFQAKKTHILVSTPVIEVGIDIPNATIMVIEDAQRFGLAQLHQLRGRVGRGDKSSYCLLFSDNTNPDILKRLNYLANTSSGIKLAEIDLKLRGPGDIYGLKQHGFLDLKLASFSNIKLLSQTSQASQDILKNIPSPLKKILNQRKIHQVSPN